MTAPNTISARTVPLDKLWLEAQGWINPREFSGLDTSDIEEMGASIKDKGIVEPLKVARIVVAVKGGGTEEVDLVVDGQRRVLGAKEVLAKSAPIPVVDLTDTPLDATKGLSADSVDWLLIRAFTTLEREGLTSYELTSAAARWKSRGKTGEWIAKIINRSPSWVSKFLKAREGASQKLLTQWRKGEITDEQFKDLAEVKDPAKQEEKVKEVVAARKSGDVTEARIRTKEIKEAERVANGHNSRGKSDGRRDKPGVKPAVSGGQLTIDGKEDPIVKPAKPPAPRKLAPNRIVLVEMIEMATKRPPTADYVKGLMDGVRYALGEIEPQDFGKTWRQYVARIDGSGSGKPRKPAKKTTKARRPAKRAKRPAKASKKGKR